MDLQATTLKKLVEKILKHSKVQSFYILDRYHKFLIYNSVTNDFCPVAINSYRIGRKKLPSISILLLLVIGNMVLCFRIFFSCLRPHSSITEGLRNVTTGIKNHMAKYLFAIVEGCP